MAFSDYIFLDIEDVYNVPAGDDSVAGDSAGDDIVAGDSAGETTENIQEQLDYIRTLLEPEEEEEEEEEGLIAEEFESNIRYEKPVDKSLYFTSRVEEANLNDIYTMVLSIRNIVLLFFMFFVVFKFLEKLKGLIYRITNK